MKRNAGLTVAVALMLSSLSLSAREVSESKGPGQEAAEQVRRLRDDSFEVRDEAARRLAEMGKSAVAALQLGLTDNDLEVRTQCQVLLERANRSELTAALDDFLMDHQEKHVLKLPAWSRFGKLAGNDPAAKALFVEMCCNEAPLLEALEKDPRQAAEKFTARCLQLQQSLFTPNGQRNTVTFGQVVALLFVATDTVERDGVQVPRLQLNSQACYPINALVQQPLPREGFQRNGVARKLLVTYIEQCTEPNVQNQNLYLVMNLSLKECVGWALKIAKTNTTRGYVRATALSVVGRLGGKEHIAALEPFLTDTTPLNQSMYNSVRIQTEVRDVALAMMVQLSGQKAADYGFPYLAALPPALRTNPQNVFFAPTMLGFSDAAGRDAALKRWKESGATKK